MGASPILRAPAQLDAHSSLVEGEQQQRNHGKELGEFCWFSTRMSAVPPPPGICLIRVGFF